MRAAPFRKLFALVPVWLSILACDVDPARNVKIIARPGIPIDEKTLPVSRQWRPAECPSPGEYKTGPSAVKIAGPCPLDFRTEVICHAVGDDFHVSLKSKGKDNEIFALNMTVESYHGPGSYDDVPMTIWVRMGKNSYQWYRWSGHGVGSVVGPDEAYLSIEKTELRGEPMRSACSREPGRSNDIKYDCEGITGSLTGIESTSEFVQGKFVCAKTK